MNGAIGFLVVIINFALTIRLSTMSDLTTTQKIAQTCIVWLLPTIGALLISIYLFSIRGEGPSRSRSQHALLESEYPGINLDSSHGSFGPHGD